MTLKTRIIGSLIALAILVNIALPFFPGVSAGKLLICTESGYKYVDAKNAIPDKGHPKAHCPFCLLSQAVKNPFSLPLLANVVHPKRDVIALIADTNILFGKAHSPAYFTPRSPPILL